MHRRNQCNNLCNSVFHLIYPYISINHTPFQCRCHGAIPLNLPAKMEAKPRRALSRVNYCKLADVKLSRRKQEAFNKVETGSKPDKLYRLHVLEEDKGRDQVKVHYVGYDSEYDGEQKRTLF